MKQGGVRLNPRTESEAGYGWGAQSFPFKILFSFAFSAFLLISALILFGLHQARKQDAAEIEYTRKALVSGLDAKAKSLRSWLKGYALWDDLYVRMARTPDKKWVDANMGPGVWKSFTMPMTGVYVADRQNGVHYSYWAHGKAPSLNVFTDVDLDALRRAADRTDTPLVANVLLNSQPYMLSIGRLRPMNPALVKPTDQARYLIWLQPITGSVLNDINRSMTIKGLRWMADFQQSSGPSLDLFPGKAIAGRISWTPRQPGTEMIRSAALPTLALLIATCLVGLSQYWAARRLNNLLLDKQREAEVQAAKSQHAMASSEQAEQEAQALMLRLREQERAVDRLSREREQEGERRKAQAREQSLATLALFEQDFDTVLQPISEIAMILNAQSSELAQEAEAGRHATAVVVDAAHESSEAIECVVQSNQALHYATASLDGNVSEAVASTQRAEQTIDELIAGLADLSANTVTVESVVSSVATIASRINTLALNARIEAARAGESGHGFAIVANEVRQMAELTSEATGSITAVLRMMQDNTQAATNGIHDVRAIVGEIAVGTNSSRTALDHQGMIAREIGNAVLSSKGRMEDTDAAVRKLEGVIGSSERMALSMIEAASELRERSERLQKHAQQFADTPSRMNLCSVEAVQPFRIAIADDVSADLHRRRHLLILDREGLVSQNEASDPFYDGEVVVDPIDSPP